MSSNDRINDFLAAVEDLRGNHDAVRTTAHTSSVSAADWSTHKASTATED